MIRSFAVCYSICIYEGLDGVFVFVWRGGGGGGSENCLFGHLITFI